MKRSDESTSLEWARFKEWPKSWEFTDGWSDRPWRTRSRRTGSGRNVSDLDWKRSYLYNGFKRTVGAAKTTAHQSPDLSTDSGSAGLSIGNLRFAATWTAKTRDGICCERNVCSADLRLGSRSSDRLNEASVDFGGERQTVQCSVRGMASGGAFHRVIRATQQVSEAHELAFAHF